MPEHEVGDLAPEFELEAGDGERVSLAGLLELHKFVALAFFPAPGSEACSDEALVIEAVIDDIERLGAGVIGISAADPDPVRAWSEELGLSYPVAADVDPLGGVAKSYGVYDEDGACKRAQFVIDRDRRIQLAHVVPREHSPGARALLKRLEELNAGG